MSIRNSFAPDVAANFFSPVGPAGPAGRCLSSRTKETRTSHPAGNSIRTTTRAVRKSPSNSVRTPAKRTACSFFGNNDNSPLAPAGTKRGHQSHE